MKGSNYEFLRDENYGIHQFGYNDDVDGAASIWSGVGAFPWADVGTNEATTIKSGDAKDAAAGVGLRTVSVQGLVNQTSGDATTGKLTRETVTLNGTTAVTMTNEFAFIIRIKGLTAGSETDNAGIITAYHGSDDIAVMQAGENRTEMAVMVVPGFTKDGHAIKGAWLLGFYASVAKTADVYADVVLRGMGDSNGTVWLPYARTVVSRSTPVTKKLMIPKYVKPGFKLDLYCEAISAANADMSGGFYLRYDV